MTIFFKLLSFLFCLFFAHAIIAQKQAYTKPKPKTATHQDIFNQKMQMPRPLSMAEGVVAVGKSFIGNPYPKSNVETSGKTPDGQVVLQPISKEVLVINLKKFECVTFVESMFSLTETQMNRTPTYNIFKNNIAHIRYRKGVIDYAARLHYFSDWLFENEKRGILTNITKEIGGEIYNKDVFYMSYKRDTFYGNMADPRTFNAIKNIEENITKREKWYIPKEKVADIESQLKEGDIIGITNVMDGMDMAHTGLVTWQNGRAYMLHASSQFRQVIITDVPLVDYLLRNKGQSGIMVGRLKG